MAMNSRRTLTNTIAILASIAILTSSYHAALAKPTHHHSRSASTSSDSHPSKHHHHSSDSQSSAGDSHPTHHSSRLSKLEREVQEQNDELYALRHERTALKARTERLARIAHRHSSDSADTSGDSSSSHKKHHHHADANNSSSMSPHAARLHHKEALAYQAHEERLAEIQAHDARLHAIKMHEIALAEQERQKHKDAKSKIVHVAVDSGLPVWDGEAYVAQVPVRIVTVNLNDPRVKVSMIMAESGVGTSEKFSHMIDRAHPYVAVTGTFFSLDNLRPVGDIVIDGSLAYFGGMGTALAIKPDNHADMITVPWGHHHDWSGYNTVVACGPRLLCNGQIVLDPAQEHFKDQHMLAPNSRIAVGITGHNQLVFCMTREPIYLGRLAKVMHSLGCQQAMNLDAGISTGFYCNGNMIASPGRRLTNAIVVYTNNREASSSVNANAASKIQLNPPAPVSNTAPSNPLTFVDAHTTASPTVTDVNLTSPPAP
jgi:hypothetical protein